MVRCSRHLVLKNDSPMIETPPERKPSLLIYILAHCCPWSLPLPHNVHSLALLKTSHILPATATAQKEILVLDSSTLKNKTIEPVLNLVHIVIIAFFATSRWGRQPSLLRLLHPDTVINVFYNLSPINLEIILIAVRYQNLFYLSFLTERSSSSRQNMFLGIIFRFRIISFLPTKI
jgi:hypothetical protein